MMEETKQVETQALTVAEKVNTITVTDTESYQNAGMLWKEIKVFRAKVAETFDPIIKAAHKAHKAAVAKKNEVDKPLDEAQRKIKRMMADYDEEQERKRREEEERLRKIAEKEEEERR